MTGEERCHLPEIGFLTTNLGIEAVAVYVVV